MVGRCRWGVIGRTVRGFLLLFILFTECSVIVARLVGRFLFFLLLLLLLEECSVDIITVTEVQYEEEDGKTDQQCYRELHIVDW